MFNKLPGTLLWDQNHRYLGIEDTRNLGGHFLWLVGICMVSRNTDILIYRNKLKFIGNIPRFYEIYWETEECFFFKTVGVLAFMRVFYQVSFPVYAKTPQKRSNVSNSYKFPTNLRQFAEMWEILVKISTDVNLLRRGKNLIDFYSTSLGFEK